MEGKAKAATVLGFVSVGLGVIGCCCGWFTIVPALVCAIISLVFFKKATDAGIELEGAAKAAKICAIVGLIVSGLAVVSNILLAIFNGGMSILTMLQEYM